jgi:hypothetical protein
MLKFEQGKVKVEISYGMLVSLGVIGFGLWYLLKDDSKPGLLGYVRNKAAAFRRPNVASNVRKPSPPPPVPREVPLEGNGNDGNGNKRTGTGQGSRWGGSRL